MQTTTEQSKLQASAEQRLKSLAVDLLLPPEPFRTYAEAVQTGTLLFLKHATRRVAQREIHRTRWGPNSIAARRKATRLAAVNALAVARQRLGSLNRVRRIVRLGVMVATAGDVRDRPKVADGALLLHQPASANSFT